MVTPRRPKRNDEPIVEDIFPSTELGKLVRGIHRSFLIKYEPRLGWARKAACQGGEAQAYPCESVGSHQWGVIWLIFTLSTTESFRTENADFDKARAYEMAAIHDLAELVTGDITPVDGISVEEKHRRELEAMKSILGFYPQQTEDILGRIYNCYENRQCKESKFVKDCDRLDFMITAFLLERQGFTGFGEFYENSSKAQFSTQIARDVADLLVSTRNHLFASNKLYPAREL